MPQKTGVGTRYFDPANPGHSVFIEAGHPLFRDLMHRGPYVKITSPGRPDVRIPLQGNPVLEVR